MLELAVLLLEVIPAAFRSRRDLVLENLLPRDQLAIACRPTRRPRLRTWDTLLWLLGGRLCVDWRQHLVLVTRQEAELRRPYAARSYSRWSPARTGVPRTDSMIRCERVEGPQDRSAV